MSLSPTARDAAGRQIDPHAYHRVRAAPRLPPRPPRPQLPPPVEPIGPFVRPSVGRIYVWSAWERGAKVAGPRLDFHERGGFQGPRERALADWRDRKEWREFERLCGEILRGRAA